MISLDSITLVTGVVIADDQCEGSIPAGEQPLYNIDNISFNPTLFSSQVLERAEQSVALAVIKVSTVGIISLTRHLSSSHLICQWTFTLLMWTIVVKLLVLED